MKDLDFDELKKWTIDALCKRALEIKAQIVKDVGRTITMENVKDHQLNLVLAKLFFLVGAKVVEDYGSVESIDDLVQKIVASLAPEGVAQ